MLPTSPIERVDLPQVNVSNIEVEEQSLSFDVDKVGVPVLVRVSYFPNWNATGADGPYRDRAEHDGGDSHRQPRPARLRAKRDGHHLLHPHRARHRSVHRPAGASATGRRSLRGHPPTGTTTARGSGATASSWCPIHGVPHRRQHGRHRSVTRSPSPPTDRRISLTTSSTTSDDDRRPRRRDTRPRRKRSVAPRFGSPRREPGRISGPSGRDPVAS